jgi:hypothetical protein
MNKLEAKEDILSFLEFMLEHPELRFWQGLLAWHGAQGNSVSKILIEDGGKVEDTFYK